MQLSKNFSLNELIKSQTAMRLGINNVPSSQEIFNLKNLCENILQRVRDRFIEPVIINSGYRSVKESEGPRSGWIHVSYVSDNPRKQALLADKDKNNKTRYMPWL